MMIRIQSLRQTISRHFSRGNPIDVDAPFLMFLAEPMIPNINMPEACLNSLIMDHGSDRLAIVTVDSSGGTLEADIMEEVMPPN